MIREYSQSEMTNELNLFGLNSCATLEFISLMKAVLAWCDTSDVVIAGGALRDTIRNTKYNDIDMYVKSDNEFNSLSEALQMSSFKYVNKTIYAHNYCHPIYGKVQVIPTDTFNLNKRKSFPEAIIETFDFNINQVAYFFKTDSFFLDDLFAPDLSRKSLRFNEQSRVPHDQILQQRMWRFMRDGFSIVQSQEHIKEKYNSITRCKCGECHPDTSMYSPENIVKVDSYS